MKQFKLGRRVPYQVAIGYCFWKKKLCHRGRVNRVNLIYTLFLLSWLRQTRLYGHWCSCNVCTRQTYREKILSGFLELSQRPQLIFRYYLGRNNHICWMLSCTINTYIIQVGTLKSTYSYIQKLLIIHCEHEKYPFTKKSSTILIFLNIEA